MTSHAPLLVLGALFGAISGAAYWLVRGMERDLRVAERIQFVQQAAGIAPRPLPGGGGKLMVRLVGRFGERLRRSGLLPAATVAELEQTLLAAGFRGGHGLGLFIGCKVLLLAVLPLIGLAAVRGFGLSGTLQWMVLAGAGVIGLVAPDLTIKRLRGRYLKSVGRGLPDALDMMVICAEAGLGLEPAIERVAGEIRLVHPAIANEFAMTAGEMRIVTDRRQALVNMGARTQLDTMRRLGATLVQTMQYGTPLSEALRTLSVELRQEALTRFEEKAARLPVLLTLPMILFILPCVFIVVGGPAALQVMRSFAAH